MEVEVVVERNNLAGEPGILLPGMNQGGRQRRTAAIAFGLRLGVHLGGNSIDSLAISGLVFRPLLGPLFGPFFYPIELGTELQ